MRWTKALPLCALIAACATAPETSMKATAEGATTLVGRAENAKGGAVLLVGEVPYYVLGLDAWPDALLHQRVQVTGVPGRRQYLPEATVDASGAVSQGAVGPQDVLEDATWRLAE